ncbi:hypothetical protein DDF65_21625 [Caulobacter radicis]|uniref:Uncharacterized protein n=1 Tax=Caulobacter radicis TaxID=2172650 RepID=A0A2T9IZU5_9CAUL|nr:hypothetical protein DDF65_21625 [Caulobacter radicis]
MISSLSPCGRGWPPGGRSGEGSLRTPGEELCGQAFRPLIRHPADDTFSRKGRRIRSIKPRSDPAACGRG